MTHRYLADRLGRQRARCPPQGLSAPLPWLAASGIPPRPSYEHHGFWATRYSVGLRGSGRPDRQACVLFRLFPICLFPKVTTSESYDGWAWPILTAQCTVLPVGSPGPSASLASLASPVSLRFQAVVVPQVAVPFGSPQPPLSTPIPLGRTHPATSPLPSCL